MDVVLNMIIRSGPYATVITTLALLTGCQLTRPAVGDDPFATIRPPQPLARNKTPASTSLGANSAAPGNNNPVVTASFEQAQQQQTNAAVNAGGVSLGKAPTDLGKSWWEKATESLNPKSIKNSALTAVGMGPDMTIAKQKLIEANTAFEAKKYDEAAKLYKEAARRAPDSPLEEDAMFMQAESEFFADRYSTATDSYANLLKKYEGTRYINKVMQRQYAVGRYWDDKGKQVYNYVPNVSDKTRPFWDTAGHSIAVYESIRLNDPTGPLADDAIMATANAYFREGKFEDAAYHYDLLRKDYPKSEHQAQAHLLGLQSRMNSYQGSQYDSTPLAEAEKLADTTVKQFANAMPEERTRLLETQNKIRIQQAERDFENGEYYYRRGYYGAAKYYFEVVADKYPETALAQMARDRIAASKDKLPEPPNYFRWFGKVFGERDRSRGVY